MAAAAASGLRSQAKQRACHTAATHLVHELRPGGRAIHRLGPQLGLDGIVLVQKLVVEHHAVLVGLLPLLPGLQLHRRVAPASFGKQQSGRCSMGWLSVHWRTCACVCVCVSTPVRARLTTTQLTSQTGRGSRGLSWRRPGTSSQWCTPPASCQQSCGPRPGWPARAVGAAAA